MQAEPTPAARPLGEPQRDVPGAQGDGAEALSAYRATRAIREALAARDPANTQWQNDVAVSCRKLGELDHGQTVKVRHGHLDGGRQILVTSSPPGA